MRATNSSNIANTRKTNATTASDNAALPPPVKAARRSAARLAAAPGSDGAHDGANARRIESDLRLEPRGPPDAEHECRRRVERRHEKPRGQRTASTKRSGSRLDRDPRDADQSPGSGADATASDSHRTTYQPDGRDSSENRIPTSHSGPTHDTDSSAAHESPDASNGLERRVNDTTGHRRSARDLLKQARIGRERRLQLRAPPHQKEPAGHAEHASDDHHAPDSGLHDANSRSERQNWITGPTSPGENPPIPPVLAAEPGPTTAATAAAPNRLRAAASSSTTAG